MLNDLELSFLDNFEKSMWGGDEQSYWLDIENNDNFCQNIDILKNGIGFGILVDQFAYEVEDRIRVICLLYHPIAEKILSVSYYASSKFTLSSISKYWPVSDWKEDELCEFYGIKMLQKIERRLLTPINLNSFPALSKNLSKKIRNNDSIFRSRVQTRSRLLPLYGSEEKINFNIIEKCNTPEGSFAVLNGKVLESKITLGKFHKGIEYNLKNKNINQIEKSLNDIDYYCFFENKICFYLLLEKIEGEKVSEKISIGRSIILEIERIYKNLTILKNFISILNININNDFDEIFIEFHLLYENLKDSTEFSRYLIGTKVQLAYEKFLVLINQKNLSNALKLLSNVSKIPPSLALELGITGPVLRSAGFLLDWRNVNHYLIYDKLNVEATIKTTGSLSERYEVRIDDIFNSMKLILDLIEHLKEDINITKSIANNFSIPRDGDFFQIIEGNNGTLVHSAFVLNSKIIRYRISSPDYALIKLFEKVSVNEKLSHSELIWNSLGINLGLAER